MNQQPSAPAGCRETAPGTAAPGNLFVCHTQAQLILASGLATERFARETNDLILFVDFALREEMRRRLERIFDRVLFLQSIYPKEYDTFRAKLSWYPADLKRIRAFMSQPYGRVFESCDTVFLEQRILKYACKANPEAELIWLEDGITAYFQNVETHGGLDSNTLTRTLRKALFKYLCGAGKYYDRDFAGMGGSRMLRTIYAQYPDAIREPYRSLRRAVGITDSEYRSGLRALYEKRALETDPNSVILVMDKLDTYLHPEKVRAAVSACLAAAKTQGREVVCKFHPRETEVWEEFEGIPAFDRSVGIESLYLSLLDRRETLRIVGVKSTGLASAKKLGYRVESLFGRSGETNPDLESFFRKIGIELL